MPTHGNRDQKSDAPKFVTDATTGRTGQQDYGNTVFGVSVAEAKLTKGVTHPGWVKVRKGTGGRAGRITYETEVAMSTIVTDATDFANTSNANVANSSGTADDATFPGH